MPTDTANSSSTRTQNPLTHPWVLGSLVGLISGGLPLMDIAIHGWKKAFLYLNQDAFYYLTVAANFGDTYRFTFDQEKLTNGFHPLWQAVLALEAIAVRRSEDPRSLLILLSFLSSSLLVGLGSGLIAAAASRPLGRAAPILMLLPIGIMGLAMLPVNPWAATVWQLSNGMESGAAIFFFGLVAILLIRADSLNDLPVWRLGFALALMVLSRLDTIFILGGFAAVTGMESLLQKNRDGFRKLSLTITVASVPIGAYMVSNLLIFGSPMPISGSLKTSFPHVSRPNLHTVQAFLSQPDDVTLDLTWRTVAAVMPIIIVALVFLLRGLGPFRRRVQPTAPGSPGWERFVKILAIGVVFHHLYNSLFVSFMEQGQWYYPITFFAVSLLVFDLVRRALNPSANGNPDRPIGQGSPASQKSRALSVLLGVTLTVGMLGTHARLYFNREGTNRQQQTFEYRDHLLSALAGREDIASIKLLTLDDGAIAYATGLPSLSGLGLCLDVESVPAREENRLVEHAFDRGFRYLAVNPSYFDFSEMTPDELKANPRRPLRSLLVLEPSEFRHFELELIYRHPADAVAIFELTCRPEI